MALRLPEPRRPARRSTNTPVHDITVSSIASALVVLFGLRAALAALQVEPWTTPWRILAVLTFPVVRPLEYIDFLNQSVTGDLTMAELAALIMVGVVALYLIASLTVRPAS